MTNKSEQWTEGKEREESQGEQWADGGGAEPLRRLYVAFVGGSYQLTDDPASAVAALVEHDGSYQVDNTTTNGDLKLAARQNSLNAIIYP